MLDIRNLGKRLGAHTVLRDVSFSVARGEIFTLLGASGSGKTTLLRILAGLETADGGAVSLNGTVWADAARGTHLAPRHRNIGLVFQSYAIWPHLSVFANVAYPLRNRKVPRRQIAERVARMLDVVGLQHLANRPATHLSGGQQQRVAMARALVAQPDVLLLDEPFSNLDVGLRQQLRYELLDLQKRLGLTVVLVTHDHDDAFALSDRIGVLEHGRMSQVARPAELYDRPASAFIHEFIGHASRVRGRMAGHALTGEVPGVGEIPITLVGGHGAAPASAAGAALDIWVRPRDVRIVPTRNGRTADAYPRPHRLQGHVRRLGFRGDHYEVHVALADGQEVRVFAPRDDVMPEPGAALELHFLKSASAQVAQLSEPSEPS